MRNLLHRISELEEIHQSYAIVTIVHTEGSVPGKVGFKLLIESAEKTYGTVGGGNLERQVIEDGNLRLDSGKSGLESYRLTDQPAPEGNSSGEKIVPMMCSGKVTVYFDIYRPLNTLYLFGGGHVGNALLYHLRPLSFRTVLIDNRPEFANPEKNPNARELVNQNYLDYVKNFEPSNNSFIIIMTHQHAHDYEILSNLYKLNKKVRYVGVIASKSKANKTIVKLRTDLGAEIDLSNLYMPIGLDIGGDSPAEIALSIASELIAVLNKKTVNNLSTELRT